MSRSPQATAEAPRGDRARAATSREAAAAGELAHRAPPQAQPLRFGFVVHPLRPMQQRLLGLRSADLSLLSRRRSARGARLISTLQLEDPHGRSAQGVLVGIPQLTERLLEDQEAGVLAVSEAVELCAQWGAQIVGLGAVAAVIGGQGKAVAQAARCAVTTGNGMTALAAADTVEAVRFQLGQIEEPLALIGPPGPVANALLAQLVARGFQVEIPLAKPPRPLERQVEQLNAQGPGRALFVADPLECLRQGRLLVAASSTGSRLRRTALPPGSVVIDVAAPQDVLLDGPRRADILIIDGEYMRLPSPLAGGFWQQLYRRVTQQSQHIFACFAEPMLLSLAQRPDLVSTGRSIPLERIRTLGQLACAHGFGVDTLHSEGRPITETQWARFHASSARSGDVPAERRAGA